MLFMYYSLLFLRMHGCVSILMIRGSSVNLNYRVNEESMQDSFSLNELF